MPETSDELQTALVDMQRYLQDEIPPLTASEAFQTLMIQPPQLMMRHIHAWAVEQSRVQSASMCDLLFHALKKVYLFGNLKLVDRGAVELYMNQVTPFALEACPADDRDLLRTNLVALRDSRNLSTASVVELGRAEGAPVKPPPVRGAVTEAVTRSARRLGLAIERLARFIPGVKTPATTSPAPEEGAAVPLATPAAELLAMAAASSTSEQELKEYLESLRPYTGDTKAESLFRILANSLPSWDIVIPPDANVTPAAPVEAMHKIISLTRDATESAKRFRELMAAAIEQFNAGSLSAAVSMLELAQSVITEKKLDPSTVERVRADAVDSISSEQMKKYQDNKSKRALLPKALSFFPTLTKESLLEQLRGEQKPERRRALLGLLEAYGLEARKAALAEIEVELNRPQTEVDTYYLRNVIYLLHRIPRESDEGLEKELELLTRSSARGQSIYVIKEAVLPLGQIKTEGSVKLLITRLAEFEAILVRRDTSLYPMDEMQKVLDRIVAALARIATPAALLTIARHGMKPNPLLGDTRARLASLSQHDLSFDEATVNLIVNTIREDLPKKLLGRILPKRQPPPVRLIEALSSTKSEAVESLFAEIAEKFADQEVGRMAAAALENLASEREHAAAAPDGSSASLTGDLQFFGLPSLMQSLSDMQATGIVTLSAKHGQTFGKLLFVEGKFGDAQAAQLRGPDALYLLLERPSAGMFAFVPQPRVSVKVKNDPVVIMSLLLEGMRRHDELKQVSVVVPDDVCLKATAVKPTPDPDEDDPAVIRDIWVKASTGARVADWEGQIAADPYRVRRLLAHWLEEGALQPA